MLLRATQLWDPSPGAIWSGTEVGGLWRGLTEASLVSSGLLWQARVRPGGGAGRGMWAKAETGVGRQGPGWQGAP